MRNNIVIRREIAGLKTNDTTIFAEGGIVVVNGINVVVSNNTVKDSYVGIHLGGGRSSEAYVVNNIVLNSTIGIALYSNNRSEYITILLKTISMVFISETATIILYIVIN